MEISLRQPNAYLNSMKQFIKFGVVGGSGVLVNMAVLVVVRRIFADIFGIATTDPFLNILGSPFHIRWYHIMVTLAFLGANTWNYQLNRMWTFRGARQRTWLRGFFPFLLTGLGAFAVTLLVTTALVNVESPVALPPEIFDDSTGLRNRVYWANMISIVVAMPINFLVNKVWTFRGHRVISSTEPTKV
ncbi:GtrA family protein [Corynebacterium canis]|uniref:GtrA family protein n=1 Tax=Corynebacterium canis TaxID=679663 RepID=A0A5C5UE52_9CORY|nr:GtrA family protein [Corynebacterium canis]TWT24981.1 GtrA family protein [Corynebacterium canis]WJY74870.1 GtrA-like protein [Corynebacterium canis]